MLLWDFGHQTACSQKVFGGVGIYNFKARFKGAILKIKAKMTLLQFLDHISLSYDPISEI